MRKIGQNLAKILGTSLTTRFQQLITQEELAQNRYIFSSAQQFIRQSRRFVGYVCVDEDNDIIQLSPD
jgi:NADH:ubiquinone oxidoreductase subunit